MNNGSDREAPEGPEPSSSAAPDVVIRPATPVDTDELTQLRVAMQCEVEGAPVPEGASQPPHVDAIRRYFDETLPIGDFHAWVAEANGRLVACSGLVLYRRPPSRHNLTGWEAYLMNMYTEPAWRGCGLASRLVRECIAYAQTRTPARRIRLHATAAGRPL